MVVMGLTRVWEVLLPKIAEIDVRRGPWMGVYELRVGGWRGILGPVW